MEHEDENAAIQPAMDFLRNRIIADTQVLEKEQQKLLDEIDQLIEEANVLIESLNAT